MECKYHNTRVYLNAILLCLFLNYDRGGISRWPSSPLGLFRWLRRSTALVIFHAKRDHLFKVRSVGRHWNDLRWRRRARFGWRRRSGGGSCPLLRRVVRRDFPRCFQLFPVLGVIRPACYASGARPRRSASTRCGIICDHNIIKTIQKQT